jgi:hypothetical protein
MMKKRAAKSAKKSVKLDAKQVKAEKNISAKGIALATTKGTHIPQATINP